MKSSGEAIKPKQELLKQELSTFDLPSHFVLLLKRHHINTVEDLVKTDYHDLARITEIGQKRLEELTNFLHGLGLSFDNEDQFFELKREKLKKQKVLLLESIVPSSAIYNCLYRAGIFTPDQLFDPELDLSEIPFLGATKQYELAHYLKKAGYQLELIPVVERRPTKESLVEMEQETEPFWNRIDEIHQELQELIQKREELILLEQQLNKKIQADKEEVRDLKQKVNQRTPKNPIRQFRKLDS